MDPHLSGTYKCQRSLGEPTWVRAYGKAVNRLGDPMIEESFISMYARDFVRLHTLTRADSSDQMVGRRLAEARIHASLMDARKSPGHLEGLIVRLRDEARRPDPSYSRFAAEPEGASQARRTFLNWVADQLAAD